MTWPCAFNAARLDLQVGDRISPADAQRQMRTAAELLRRLEHQPGIVLADEVGMGKTFVALATAVTAVWNDPARRPVVVMVPSSVQSKWERDFQLFSDRCIRQPADRFAPRSMAGGAARYMWTRADDALDFFRLLDDPPSRRVSLIFLAHGAFHRNLQDPWTKLALLKFAMHHAKLGAKRKSIYRFAADLLRVKGSYADSELFEHLLSVGFERWREIIGRYGDSIDDDPVPKVIARTLERSEIDLTALREALDGVPDRKSETFDQRILAARQSLNASFQEVWREALIAARFRSPLLVLDEAHHVKNPATKLASLFVSDDAEEDAKLLSGALEGGFERMLFLTATPFQLGHQELLNVVGRFDGVDWKSLAKLDLAGFRQRREELASALDEAQRAAVELDSQWGRLRASDLGEASDLDLWWERICAAPTAQPERVQQVMRAYDRARTALRAAETLLKPWVVRHLRSRRLREGSELLRRTRYPGAAITTRDASARAGIEVTDSALLPFLLAARAQAMVSHVARASGDRSAYRATFAEGLASSYEAFLETRAGDADAADERALDATPLSDPRLTRSLQRLRDALPDRAAFAEHPKIAATVRRALDLWEAGEKLVVFCHYRVTGRALVKHISAALDQRLWAGAVPRLAPTENKARRLVERWQNAFDPGSRLDRVLTGSVQQAIAAAGTLPRADTDRILDVARRFIRTPLFLLRFVDLASEDREAAMREALTRDDRGGTSLHARLESFARFLVGRLTPDERAHYLDALERIQPGERFEKHDPGEIHDGAVLLPTVRLASGAVRRDTRERLLLGFNTPFFPEILVASSVMAEGVDLHLNCRHMIHHDLDWNPSTLEQRTGRIDRIGAKAEQVSRTIEVDLPYVGGTQDEKMYRVVTDRERWFQIVMGEDYRTDESATDALAERVPLPEAIARSLSLRLEVAPAPGSPDRIE